MYKKTTLLSVLLMWSLLGFSQYSYIKYTCDNQNPGNLNKNTVEDLGVVTRGWTAVLGGSFSATWSANQTIPFAFNFNGNNYTSYKVSSTGILTFDLAAVAVPDSNNVALPSALIPDNSICIWGIVARGNSNDSIGSRTFGTAPNRQHWLWFSSFSQGGGVVAGYTYWGIVLEETDKQHLYC